MTLEMAKIANLERQQAQVQVVLQEMNEKLNVLQLNAHRTRSPRMGSHSHIASSCSSSLDDLNPNHSSSSNETLRRRHGHRERTRRHRHHDEFKDLKLEVPEYDGNLDPDVLLEWITRCNRIFEVKNYNDEKSFKAAVVKLKGYASLWWENLCKQRMRKRKAPIQSWLKMQKVIKARFLPSTYTHDLYNEMASLTQDDKSVEQYIHAFEKLMMKSDLNEIEEQTMARFLRGLDKKLARKVDMYSYTTLDELYQLALKAEKHDKDKEKGAKANLDHLIAKRTETYMKKLEDKEKGKGVMVDKRVVKCFKCQGVGHYAYDCPNKRVMTIAERNEIEASLEESRNEQEQEKHDKSDLNDQNENHGLDSQNEEIVLGPVSGAPLLLTRRVLMNLNQSEIESKSMHKTASISSLENESQNGVVFNAFDGGGNAFESVGIGVEDGGGTCCHGGVKGKAKAVAYDGGFKGGGNDAGASMM